MEVVDGEKLKKKDLESSGTNLEKLWPKKRIEVKKWIFVKKEGEFGVERSRSRNDKEKRR